MARTIKNTIKSALVRSRLLRGLSALLPRSLVILRYHSICPSDHPYRFAIGEGLTRSPEEFERHVRMLTKEFRVVNMDQILRFVRGEDDLSPRAIALTFDDGYRDNYEHARVILDRYGVIGTFYVTAGLVRDEAAWPWFCRLRLAFGQTEADTWVDPSKGRRWQLRCSSERNESLFAAYRTCAALVGDAQDRYLSEVERQLGVQLSGEGPRIMMTWGEITALHESGHIVGAHTMSHPNLAHIPPDQAEQEMSLSKSLLEQQLATPVRHFSYPAPMLEPHWNQATVRLSRTLGYETGVTCMRGAVYRNTSPLCLPRIRAPADCDELRWLIETSQCGIFPDGRGVVG